MSKKVVTTRAKGGEKQHSVEHARPALNDAVAEKRAAERIASVRIKLEVNRELMGVMDDFGNPTVNAATWLIAHFGTEMGLIRDDAAHAKYPQLLEDSVRTIIKISGLVDDRAVTATVHQVLLYLNHPDQIPNLQAA